MTQNIWGIDPSLTGTVINGSTIAAGSITAGYISINGSSLLSSWNKPMMKLRVISPSHVEFQFHQYDTTEVINFLNDFGATFIEPLESDKPHVTEIHAYGDNLAITAKLKFGGEQ